MSSNLVVNINKRRISGIPGAVNYLNLARFARMIMRTIDVLRTSRALHARFYIFYIDTRDSGSISFLGNEKHILLGLQERQDIV